MTKKTTRLGKWLDQRQAVSKKSGPTIISLLTDFVVPHGGQISLGSLVEAARLLGLSEATIRSSVNRLIGEGWLHSQAMGRRSIYQFSATALRRCNLASRRIYARHATEWNGEWNILIPQTWSIPPDRYEEFVNDVSWAGFGRVSENIFIRPKYEGDSPREDEYLHDWESSVIGFTGKKDTPISRKSIKELIEHTWDLELVNARYEVFIIEHQELAEIIACSSELPRSTAFAIRSIMMHNFRRIRILDPNLPAEYLPSRWHGEEALELAGKIYNQVAAASVEFITNTMQGPEGLLPLPCAWFYRRFGGLEERPPVLS